MSTTGDPRTVDNELSGEWFAIKTRRAFLNSDSSFGNKRFLFRHGNPLKSW